MLLSGPTVAVPPPTAFEPLQPLAPDAMQLLACVEAHVSVELPPLLIVDGLAVRVTVGTGTTVTVADALALPPAPLQVSV